MATTSAELLVERALKQRGLARASELARDANISQPTVSRVLSGFGPRLVRLGAARATRYALAESVRNFGFRWPVYRVDGNARVEALGDFTSLVEDHYIFEAADSKTKEILGTGAESDLYTGLPWFLMDSRPQGFLGRTFARRNAQRLDLPSDLSMWTDRHGIAALLADGDDLPGNLILGDAMRESAMRAMLREPTSVAESQRYRAYDELARAAIAGESVGSSAAGEHPKFATAVKTKSGYRHVLVKFTDTGESAAKRRWMDLLVAEHDAATVLRESGISAAVTRIVEGRERWHLEVERFDRVGEFGRCGVVSLMALDDTLYGIRDNWPASAARLEQDGWITPEAAQTIRILHWFGRLIANTDMHFGNASFLTSNARPFALAPSYDMLPMLYRPAANGELIDREFEPAPPAPSQRGDWSLACDLALRYWQRLADSDSISKHFRALAGANGKLLHRAARQYL